MPEKKNVHKGHRERVKEKFLKYGLEIFDDHQILELVLFYMIPRRDTNEMAHRLIDGCGGSLFSVFNADTEQIQKLGFSKSTAYLLKLIPEICKRYLKERDENSKTTEGEVIKETILKFFGDMTEEKAVMVFLDSNGRMMYCNEVFKGPAVKIKTHSREIAFETIRLNAMSVIVATNHTDDSDDISDDDIYSTQDMFKLFKSIRVKLVDRVVITKSRYISFFDNEEYLDYLFGMC